MTDSTADRDPGLQQERTVLAWQRTGLALVVVTLLVIRVSTESTAWQWIAVPATAVPLAAWPFISLLRSRLIGPPVEPGFDRVMNDGRVTFALSAASALLGVVLVLVTLC